MKLPITPPPSSPTPRNTGHHRAEPGAREDGEHEELHLGLDEVRGHHDDAPLDQRAGHDELGPAEIRGPPPYPRPGQRRELDDEVEQDHLGGGEAEGVAGEDRREVDHGVDAVLEEEVGEEEPAQIRNTQGEPVSSTLSAVAVGMTSGTFF